MTSRVNIIWSRLILKTNNKIYSKCYNNKHKHKKRKKTKMNKTNNNRKVYGLFYKSHGTWTGPYNGVITTQSNLVRYANLVKGSLKSKTSIRRVAV